LILAENSNSLMESVKLMIDYADYIFEEEIKEEFLKFSSSPFEEFMVQRLNSIESQLKEMKQQIQQDTLKLQSIESKLDKLSTTFESFSTNESKEIQRIKKNLFDQNVKVDGFGKKKEPSPIVEEVKKVPPKYVYNHRGEIMNKIPFQ
jgi:deoxyribodipyrimidine photolyase